MRINFPQFFLAAAQISPRYHHNMFSKQVLITSEVSLKLSSSLGAYPLLLNGRTKKFYTTPWSRLSSRFTMILILVQIIFGTFRLLRFGNLSDKTDRDLVNFNISYIILLALVVPLFCLGVVTMNGKELVDCLNQTLHYIFHIRGRWVSLNEEELVSSHTTGKKLGLFFKFVMVLSAGYSFSGSVAIYFFDILPLHWLSLIPIQLRSRPLFCAHLGFYAHEMIISAIGVGTAVGILGSYIGECYAR